jgi:hypothetical protein
MDFLTPGLQIVAILVLVLFFIPVLVSSVLATWKRAASGS